MTNVLQLTKRLDSPPSVGIPVDYALRTYRGAEDIPLWLEIRSRAFAGQRLGVRQWDTADFENEFQRKWWWSPERLWLVEAPTWLGGQPVGTIALAMRGEPETAKPVVHWLCVLPRWRRNGLGRVLLTQAERAAWDLGHRQIWLETHAAWVAALRLYESAGYQPCERSNDDS